MIGFFIAFITFIAIIFAAWGIGDFIMNLFSKRNLSLAPLTYNVLAFVLGLGILGQFIFLMGLLGNFYRRTYVLVFLILLIIFSLTRLFKYSLYRDIKLPKMNLKWEEHIILFLTILSLVIWFYGAINFNRASDAITEHYQFAKECIKSQHFGHCLCLPFGVDHPSNYSPKLIQMIFLLSKIIADDRTANLVYWFFIVLLFAIIFSFSKDFFQTTSAFIAIAIFLGFSVLFNFSLDVNDYIPLSVFLMCSLYCIYAFLTSDKREYLILSGILGGFILSIKYYGIPLIISLCIPFILNKDIYIRKKISNLIIFITISVIVFSPWLLYNLFSYGDPLFPTFSKNVGWAMFLGDFRREDILADFITGNDRFFIRANVLYYLSLFIPFSPDLIVFALTPIFLISLPLSVMALFNSNNQHSRIRNSLFITSLVVGLLVELTSGKICFYKQALFSALIYTISLSALVMEKSEPKKSNNQNRKRMKLFSLSNILVFNDTHIKKLIVYSIITIAIVNVYFIHRFNKSISFLPIPPRWHQEELWTGLEKFINTNVEKNAVVANQDIRTNYFLRNDIKGIPLSIHPKNWEWEIEEKILFESKINYYIIDVNDEKWIISHYKKYIELYTAYSNPQKANNAKSKMELYISRTEKQRDFLIKYGRLICELPEGYMVYKISFDSEYNGPQIKKRL
ncbi:MAG: ArnT family glycosyltransferase [Vulcanimicrobiota bacterium]